jgi:hypothetical protein
LFTPRILTYSCKFCSEEVKEKKCYSDGDYCPYFPKQDLPKRLVGVSDISLLEESLRQKCLYNSLSEVINVNSNFTTWFNYVVKFRDVCDSLERFNKECSYKIMQELEIETRLIDECVLSSFVSRGNVQTDNKILRDDRAFAEKLGIVIHPAISINNMTYRGDINGYDIFRAVCVGFSKAPEVCEGDNIFAVIEVEDSGLQRPKKNFARLIHVIATVVVVIAVNCLALWCYRRYTKRKMNA